MPESTWPEIRGLLEDALSVRDTAWRAALQAILELDHTMEQARDCWACTHIHRLWEQGPVVLRQSESIQEEQPRAQR